MEQGTILIDGRWLRAAEGKQSAIYDPSTGGVIATACNGSEADIDLAVAAARRSFEDCRWRGMAPDARAQILWRVAELIEEDIDSLASAEATNAGMLIAMSKAVAQSAAECFRYHAGWCTRMTGGSNDISRGDYGLLLRTHLQPVGVAALILPWNAPLGIAAWKVAPALAAGCSIVLKPAEETPLTALRLGEILLAAGVPAGVFNIVTGSGLRTGSPLARHPDVNKLSFTGSTAVGRSLIESAAGNFKRLTLELGGKSPFVLCGDADLDAAIPSAAAAIFTHAGQICTAGSRLYVERPIYEEVVERICAAAQDLRIGSALDPATNLGPLISEKQHKSVTGHIELAKSAGFRVRSGGNASPNSGYFIEPTVITDAPHASPIIQDEVFGPVLTITPFDTIAEAQSLANDSIYGLAAYVWSKNISVANRLAQGIEAGTVWVNCAQIVDYSAPFGGFKQSGWGREHGFKGVEAYTEVKSIITAI